MSISNKYTGEDDQIEINSANKTPVCLCLDISGSMGKADAKGQIPIDKMKEGLSHFYASIASQPQAAESCEITLITFNSDVTPLNDFGSVKNVPDLDLHAQGGTALCHAVDKALNLLNDRKRLYRENGIDYYQPWLIVLTDGKPGDTEMLTEVQAKTSELVKSRKLNAWFIVVGNDEDDEKWRSIQSTLAGFTPDHPVMHLKDLDFPALFEWLGKSVSQPAQGIVSTGSDKPTTL
ncbi:MAG: VWA domain-containing protein [Bacilli bacterium]|jgi:uncharacterized protein YegL|nr:VWA domain-containing protein [Bacilli bacterium]